MSGRRLAVSLGTALALFAPTHAFGLLIDPFFEGHSTVSLGDNSSVNRPLGFSYTTPPSFSVSDVWISSNGYVTFHEPVNRSRNDLPGFANDSFRGSCCELTLIAPFWTDLDPRLGGTVTYGNPAGFPNVFVVSWVDIPVFGDATLTNTFQLALFGGSAANPFVTGFSLDTGAAVPVNSAAVAYGRTAGSAALNLGAGDDASIGVAVAESSGFNTLFGLGIGDANGVVTTADFGSLAVEDPFLFHRRLSTPPVVFASIPELSSLAPVPEPSSLFLVLLALAGLALSRASRVRLRPAESRRMARHPSH